ncbi:hypothetical protein G6F59_018817 [Rhizopus arrhizus]|nr:hypothetical protein G6F59_018817 [Rhizopus arrhizus]
MQHGVEQGDVGARRNRQVQVRERGGVRAPRIHRNHLHARASRARHLQPAEQYRMRVGHVGAGDQHGVRQLQGFIAGGRRIRTQRALVARHRA